MDAFLRITSPVCFHSTIPAAVQDINSNNSNSSNNDNSSHGDNNNNIDTPQKHKLKDQQVAMRKVTAEELGIYKTFIMYD